MKYDVILSPTFRKFVRPSEHSTFSPSAAERWENCPYSVAATSGMPDVANKYQTAGTEAHTICEDFVNHELFSGPWTQALQWATNEQMDWARGWLSVVTHWASNPALGKILFVGLEVGVPIFPEDGAFGTADLVVVGTKGAAVADFKSGKGHVVNARAAQLKQYLLGVYRHLFGVPEDYTFHAVVYQPPVSDTPKEYVYSVQELHAYAKEVKEAIDSTKRPGLQPVMGSWCQWCKARRATDPTKKCPAFKQKELDLANADFEQYLSDMNAPVPDLATENPKRDQALLKLMALKPLIDHVVKDAQAEFQERLAKGEKIFGVRLTEKLGNRTWADEDEKAMAIKLKEKYGIDPWIVPQPKLKTITLVEREVGKKNFDNGLTVRPVKKTVEVMSENMREILGEMANYGQALIESEQES